LLRWQRRDGSLVLPSQFISLLEETGLIIEVGEWVIATALDQLKQWRKMNKHDLRIAVNLSPRQFEMEGLVDAVEKYLSQASLPPKTVELEITEGLLMRDTTKTNTALCQLKELGVRIAVDDFGTGYSSLSYLHRFNVDTLKIDRSFVQHVTKRQDSASIATAIVGLGHNLGLEIIAEGVETPEQLEFMRNNGCDIIQGYIFGRPIPDWNPQHSITEAA